MGARSRGARWIRSRVVWLAVASFGVLVGAPAAALAGGPVLPKPDRYATDRTGRLDASRMAALNEKLAAFERQTSNQVLVYVDSRLPEGSVLEELAAMSFRTWGVGSKGRDNGALLLVFVDDRKMRVEVGYGLEGAIPDAIAKRITSTVVAPRFKTGDFVGGVEAGAQALMDAARGEGLAGSGKTVAEANRSQAASLGYAWIAVLAGLVGFGLTWRGRADRVGRAFSWAFGLAGASALFLALASSNVLLGVIGVALLILAGVIAIARAAAAGATGAWVAGVDAASTSHGSGTSDWSSSSSDSGSSGSDFSGGGGDSGGGGASDSW